METTKEASFLGWRVVTRTALDPVSVSSGDVGPFSIVVADWAIVLTKIAMVMATAASAPAPSRIRVARNLFIVVSFIFNIIPEKEARFWDFDREREESTESELRGG